MCSPVQSSMITWLCFAVSWAIFASVVDFPVPVAPIIRVCPWSSGSLYFCPVGSRRGFSISPKGIFPWGGGLVFISSGVVIVWVGWGFRRVSSVFLV